MVTTSGARWVAPWTACGQPARRLAKSGISGLARRATRSRYWGRPEGASDIGSHDFGYEVRYRQRWLRSSRSDGNGGFGHRRRASCSFGTLLCPPATSAPWPPASGHAAALNIERLGKHSARRRLATRTMRGSANIGRSLRHQAGPHTLRSRPPVVHGPSYVRSSEHCSSAGAADWNDADTIVPDYRGERSTRAASTSAADRSTWTEAKPSSARPARES